MSPEGRQAMFEKYLVDLQKDELWESARLFYMLTDMQTNPDEIKLAAWVRSKACMPSREQVWDFVYGEPKQDTDVSFFIPYGFELPPKWETIFKRRNKCQNQHQPRGFT